MADYSVLLIEAKLIEKGTGSDVNFRFVPRSSVAVLGFQLLDPAAQKVLQLCIRLQLTHLEQLLDLSLDLSRGEVDDNAALQTHRQVRSLSIVKALVGTVRNHFFLGNS